MNDDVQNNASGTDTGAADQSGTEQQQQPDLGKLQAQADEAVARATRAEQEAARLRGELDALQPYVRYGNEESPAANQNQAAEGEDVDPVLKLERQVQTLSQEVKTTKGDLIARTFFIENPDLRDCEDLVTTMFTQTPGRDVHERLKKAGDKARTWLKNRDARVLAEAEAQRTKRTKSEAKLEGVMDGGVTPRVVPEPEEKADLETYSGIRAKELHGGGPA